MNKFSFFFLNKIIAFVVFIIALSTFSLTVEPTASFWDAGEYISTSAKLQIGHPPGAPFYQMMGAFFSLFADGNENIALMVNFMSVLSSSFAILFLYLSLVIIIKKFTKLLDLNPENERFRQAGVVWSETNKHKLLNEVADSLVKYGVTMLPTRVVYEANRDILRAQSLPWHKKYTHQLLIERNGPDPNYHGAYHYDWTHDDEYYWTYAFDLWGDLIFEFNKKGGRVSYGSDDSYIFATPGFSNIRELQLLRETGMHTLEVLKSATYNSALTLREPRLGLVRQGYLADLIIVNESPLYNLRNLYFFGALKTNKNGEMVRRGGISHTIKDGIVINNKKIMKEVEKMVKASKNGTSPSAMDKPFIIEE